MSNAPYPQPSFDELINGCQSDHYFNELKQQFFLREQVVTALTEANAAFTAQCTDPDGYTFMLACEDLRKFLDLRIPIEYSEEKLLVQVLQVACAMHKNAINNPTLTPMERLWHHLATTSLLPLCRTALGRIINPNHLRDARRVTDQVQRACNKATDALNLAELDHSEDDSFTVPEEGTGKSSASPSIMPSSPPRPAEPGGSVQDAAAGAGLPTMSPKCREQALAMLRGKLHKTTPLGRCHTAPSLLQTTPSPSSPWISADWTPLKAHSRGGALGALEETEE